MPSFNTLTTNEITHLLNQFATSDPDDLCVNDENLIEAAVLVLLVYYENQWQVLYTRRADNVRDHKGQVSFPGGSRENEDQSFEMTALRETSEEIGLDPTNIQILSNLLCVKTISNYLIMPIVGTISWPQPLQLASDEVKRVFLIPLDWLADNHNWQKQWYQVAGLRKKRKVIVYEPYDGEILWGISATITHMLVERLKQQPR